MRKTSFTEGEFYHVYNRGVDKRDIFSEQYDILRFLQSMKVFNTIEPIGSIYEKSFFKTQFGSLTPRLIEIICYCLNPNHYHFILRQVAEKGIEKFMHRLATGYTNYFNEKYQRSGALFQGRYKAVHVNSNEYLLHLSAYINLNYLVHQLGSSASRTSWDEFVTDARNSESFCSRDIILEQFSSQGEYENFAKESLNDILERRKMAREFEELLLE